MIYLDMEDEQPKTIALSSFSTIWSDVILQFKKQGFLQSEEKFGFSWFLKVILKYKSALIQVIAYFIIQIIGLSQSTISRFFDCVTEKSNRECKEIMQK